MAKQLPLSIWKWQTFIVQLYAIKEFCLKWTILSKFKKTEISKLVPQKKAASTEESNLMAGQNDQ